MENNIHESAVYLVLAVWVAGVNIMPLVGKTFAHYFGVSGTFLAHFVTKFSTFWGLLDFFSTFWNIFGLF